MIGMEQVGKAWRHPQTGEIRYYVNDAWRLGGLEVERYKSGNICAAQLDGEEISNSEAGRLVNACEKVWFTEDGEVHFKGVLMGDSAVAFRERVKAAIEEAIDCAVADAQADEMIARGEEALDAYLASLE